MTKEQAAYFVETNVEQAKRLLSEAEQLATEHEIPFTYELNGNGPSEDDYDNGWQSSRVC